MTAIKQLFHIDAKRSDVYKALTTINGLQNWWTIQTEGQSELNGIIKFRFGNHGGPDMKVTELIPDEKISWTCVKSDHGWTGHTLTFLLDENDGKTRVRFTHDGWNVQDDFMRSATLAGEDIWKACDSFVKQVLDKLSAAKHT